MNLDEYIWRSKLSATDIAKKIDCSPNTLGKIKRRESTAGLVIAMKLADISEGQIAMSDLLSEQDAKAYENWISEKRAKQV